MKIESVNYFPGGVPVRVGWRFRFTRNGKWHYALSDAWTGHVIQREKGRRR